MQKRNVRTADASDAASRASGRLFRSITKPVPINGIATIRTSIHGWTAITGHHPVKAGKWQQYRKSCTPFAAG